jgi:hypothetical protein
MPDTDDNATCCANLLSTTVVLNAREVQTLICAMAGNFPPRLGQYRMGLLRKLARAAGETDAMS